jgi:hypothetical protein
MVMALYSPSSNSLLAAGLVIALALLVGAPLAMWIYVRTPYNSRVGEATVQPVMFDHRHHVADDGIDCRYCHYTVERSPYAGVPPTAVCMNCHSQIWSSSVQLRPVRESYFYGKLLVWPRVTSLPDFVYFNHAIHVRRGIGCASCHGRVDRMAAVYKAEPMNMSWCLSCHRDPAAYLRPEDHITDMDWNPPNQREIGERIQRERKIAPPTNCTACHR